MDQFMLFENINKTTEIKTSEETTEQVVEVIQNEVGKAAGLLSDLGTRIKQGLPSLVLAVIMLIVGIIAARLLTFFISKTFKRSKMDTAARGFLVSLIKIILYMVVIMMALTMINVPMSSIITIFGAAGLAISLALQNCLSNLCGGFIILFSKPFVSGDKIEFDGSQGIVKSISILYTKIVTADNKTVFVPNGKISDAKIINFTESPTRRVDMQFSISYDSDFRKAQEIINEIISQEELILKDAENTVRMSSHGDSSINIDVFVWALNENYYKVKYNLNEAVKEVFDANGIEIPYNQLDVRIKEQN